MENSKYEILIFSGISGKTLCRIVVCCDYDVAIKTAEKARTQYAIKRNCFCDYIIHEITVETMFDRKHAISTIYTDNRDYATLRYYKDNAVIFEKTYKSYNAARKAEISLAKKFC
jgi:hypothetical protein